MNWITPLQDGGECRRLSAGGWKTDVFYLRGMHVAKRKNSKGKKITLVPRSLRKHAQLAVQKMDFQPLALSASIKLNCRMSDGVHRDKSDETSTAIVRPAPYVNLHSHHLPIA